MFRSPRTPRSDDSGPRSPRSPRGKKTQEEFILHRAVEADNEDWVKELVAVKGVDINETNMTGETALLMAIRLKKESMALVLLELGADPDIGNTEYVRTLVEQARSKNTEFTDSESVLMMPAKLAKSYGLAMAYAAITEAQRRKLLTNDIAILHAISPIQKQQGSTSPRGPESEVDVYKTKDDKLNRKKTLRQLISAQSNSPGSSSNRSNENAPANAADSTGTAPPPPALLGKHEHYIEVHAMTARRTSFVKKTSSYAPSMVPSEANNEAFKCMGTECSIM